MGKKAVNSELNKHFETILWILRWIMFFSLFKTNEALSAKIIIQERGFACILFQIQFVVLFSFSPDYWKYVSVRQMRKVKIQIFIMFLLILSGRIIGEVGTSSL